MSSCFKSIGTAFSISASQFSAKILPILVESATAVFRQVFSKDCLEDTETLGCFNVANDTNNDHRWSFDDSYRLDYFLLVHFRTRLIDFTHDVSHSSLVAHEGSQMDRFLRVIFRESLHLTSMTLAPLLWEEADMAMSRSRKLTMRLKVKIVTLDKH